MTCLFWEPGKKANCVHSTINPNRLLFFLVLTIFCCFLQLYHWHYAKVTNFISPLLLAQDQRGQSWVGKIGSSCPLRLPIRTQDSLHIAHMHCQQYDKCIHLVMEYYHACTYTWHLFHSKHLCSHTHPTLVCLWQETHISCQQFINNMLHHWVSVIIPHEELRFSKVITLNNITDT